MSNNAHPERVQVQAGQNWRRGRRGRRPSIGILVALGLSVGACGTRSLGEPPVDSVPAVATDITVEIWSDGKGLLLETRTLPSEGPLTVDPVEVDPFSEPPQYFLFAKAAGFFTELYLASWGDTVEVDLDAVPALPAGVAGVVFHMDPQFAPCLYSGERLGFTRPGPDGPPSYEYDVPMRFQNTDALGRYGLGGLELGDWLMVFTPVDREQVFTLHNTAGTDYLDIFFYEEVLARAPNLYLYPHQTTDVRVILGFPEGGRLVESAPPYGEAWSVTVAPDGVVDGRWPYLYYEAAVPLGLQTREGWVVPGHDLASGLAALLGALGFQGREIDDFLETWVPLWAGEPAWALYPQVADSVVTLDIWPRPDRVRRVWLYARPVADAMASLPEPARLPPLVRDGFTAVEWGVILGR